MRPGPPSAPHSIIQNAFRSTAEALAGLNHHVMTDASPHRVFISYAREDHAVAKRLYRDLKSAGLSPWIASKDLLGGQKWRTAIQTAIRESAYFLALMSHVSVGKRGYVQKEVREALDVLDQMPDDDVYLIPVRLDECEPSHDKLKEVHWIDLFPSYAEGFNRILQAISVELEVYQPTAPATSPVPTGHILTFAQIVETRPQSQIKNIQSQLARFEQESAVNSHVVTNIRLESRLPADAWSSMMDQLLAADETPSSIGQCLLEFFRAHMLLGPLVQMPSSATCLSVIRFENFLHHLLRLGHFHSMDNARVAMRRILSEPDGKLVRKTLQDTPLTAFLQWCTFEPDGTRPFDGEPQTSEYYLSSLGSPLPASHDSLLVFEYTLPDTAQPRIPTVCDAGMYIGFRPAPPSSVASHHQPEKHLRRTSEQPVGH